MRIAVDVRELSAGRLTGIGRLVAAFMSSAPGIPGIEIVPVAPHASGWRDVAALPGAVARARADVFWSPYHKGPLWGRTPIVVSFHDLTFLRGPMAFAWRPYLEVMVRRARGVICGTRAARREVEAAFPSAAPKIEVIPYPVAGRFFDPVPPEAGASVRRRLGLPDRYVLYVGNGRPHKNLPGLLRGYSGLSDADRAGLGLALVGLSDAEWAGLEPEARRLGVRASVIHLGRVADDDLPACYAGATVVALLSRAEGFGYPVLEAMACGTPVLAADRGSLPEVAGGAALLVDPDDGRAVVSGLHDILTDRALRERLAAQGRARASEFTEIRFTQALIAMLRKAAGAHHGLERSATAGPRLLARALQAARDAVSAPVERTLPSGGWIPARVREAAEALVPDGSSVVEFGCGEGLFLDRLARSRRPSRLAGVEINPEQVVRARARLGPAVEVGPDAPAGAFETVVCINVLQGAGSAMVRDAMIRRCVGLLGSRGRLILEARNFWNPILNLWYRMAHRVDSTLPRPLRTDRPSAIAAQLREAGLAVKTVRPVPRWLGVFAPAVIVVADRERQLTTDPFRFLPVAAVAAGAGTILRVATAAPSAVGHLEARLAAYLGARRVVTASSGKTALYLLLRALQRLAPDRDEVILPAYTDEGLLFPCRGIVSKITLVDIPVGGYTMGGSEVARLVTERTLAVIAVHQFGLAVDLGPLLERARAVGAFVLEDCAQAFGGILEGRTLGMWGDGGFTSFGRGKNLAAAGGGAAWGNRRDLEEALREIEGELTDPRGDGFGESRVAIAATLAAVATVSRPRAYAWARSSVRRFRAGPPTGFMKTKIGAARAVAALAALERMDADAQAREANGRALAEALRSHGGSRPIPVLAGRVALNRFPLWCRSSADRDEILARLRSGRVEAEILYPRPLDSIHVTGGDFPGAREAALRILTLPVHPFVTAADCERMAGVIA